MDRPQWICRQKMRSRTRPAWPAGQRSCHRPALFDEPTSFFLAHGRPGPRLTPPEIWRHVNKQDVMRYENPKPVVQSRALGPECERGWLVFAPVFWILHSLPSRRARIEDAWRASVSRRWRFFCYVFFLKIGPSREPQTAAHLSAATTLWWPQQNSLTKKKQNRKKKKMPMRWSFVAPMHGLFGGDHCGPRLRPRMPRGGIP